MHLLTYTWLRAKHHNTQKILLPYRFCGDSHHAFAFPFVLIFLPLRLSCKESSTSNQAFSIVFTTPSVPLIGDRNLRKKDVTALLGARNRYAIRLAGHQSSRHILRDGTAGRGKFIVNSLHVYATCLRTHIIKHMIISVICTNIRKDNKFKWLS